MCIRDRIRDIFIGYEALAWGKYISDHRDAWEIVRRANHKHVGIILDSFHTLSKGINLDTITSIPKEKIFFVQIADAPKYNMDLLFWSRHFRNMPGQGDLKVSEFMKKINDTGYDINQFPDWDTKLNMYTWRFSSYESGQYSPNYQCFFKDESNARATINSSNSRFARGFHHIGAWGEGNRNPHSLSLIHI